MTSGSNEGRWAYLDGNEAVASVAHRLSEVCALYPITPASPMGEHADAWSQQGRTNLWGQVPRIVEMQSEAGAIGALHGAVQSGVLATSFTSSQGLLLMLPDMFKIAGELTPAVLHVAARAVATHALSIFGDHSDVMAARGTGWAMLASNTVQEAHDLAAVAHAASLAARIPFIHFIDGFRTSHEIQKIELLPDDVLCELVDSDAVLRHRERALRPTSPVLRGTSQNPDVFFQSREAANPFYLAVPDIVGATMARFAALTGRRYDLVEYHGSPAADRVVVVMGSAARTVCATADALNAAGAQVGVLAVRLYRPFPAAALAAALPPTVRALAVLDRAKEPGAAAEPLHLDVLTAVTEHCSAPPRVIGGRYGLGSKEFGPRDAKAVFDELAYALPRRPADSAAPAVDGPARGATGTAAGAEAAVSPVRLDHAADSAAATDPDRNVAGRPVRSRFTVGITDDVTHLSLPADPLFRLPTGARQAVFYGLGSDGTVGAIRATARIIGEHTGQWVQGYFVYDSKKAGSVTASHLRYGPDPVDAPYLIEDADFVAVHQFGLLSRLPVLGVARPGATVLLACRYPAGRAWEHLPQPVRQAIAAKHLSVYVVDAAAVARGAGLAGRINTTMQACFFALAKVLPADRALAVLEDNARTGYGRLGPAVVEANIAAIRGALAGLAPLAVPDDAPGKISPMLTPTSSLVPVLTPAPASSAVSHELGCNSSRVRGLQPSSAVGVGSSSPGELGRSSLAVGVGMGSPGELGRPSSPGGVGSSSAVAAGQPDVLATVRRLIAGEGDLLPVSALPPDGTFPTGTAALEKRGLAAQVPVWTPDACIDCGKCTLACPHAALRMAVFDEAHLRQAPGEFLSKPTMGRDFPSGTRLTVQVSPDDCTGCTLCVTVCPTDALAMRPTPEVVDVERRRWDYFVGLPDADRTTIRTNTVKGSQLLRPLFEFSGACSGCGETPYLKLLSQLLGDRIVIANATGCSSIYGGNLPTTPWAADSCGRGPAWSNSLFEDNAEFAMGMSLAAETRAEQARHLLAEVAPLVGVVGHDEANASAGANASADAATGASADAATPALPADVLDGLLHAAVDVTDEKAIAAQRARVDRLRAALDRLAPSVRATPSVRALQELADALVPTSVWAVGGDGWAYDIGFGGLDHLLASGRDVNVLVLDTEVYSNTGGQASKATPFGAAAKFAAAGKAGRKKDLGLLAQAYQDVYVAQIAINVNEMQAVRAFLEAAAYPGPSLLIAYSPCREQGVDLTHAVDHERAAVASGHWPLYRYHPAPAPGAAPAFRLDSKAPSIPLAEFYATETRFQAIARTDPQRAAQLLAGAQAVVDQRWAGLAGRAAR